MSNPLNLNFDPISDELDVGGTNINAQSIHIRIQQRNGRKTLTTVQGIPYDYDKRKILKAVKKEFACNGTVIDDANYGEVIQLTGDQRNHILEFLLKVGLAKKEQIKVHGF